MTDLYPSMRLKVKGDTFFLPDSDGGVYFRNNEGSFHMEGRTIHQWIEKLVPVFNGEHTFADLTDGLPEEYRNRVYEIAEVLFQNGFVRDVSHDRPHQLPVEVLKRYGQQVEFLDNLAGSGAARFQSYRQNKVLAVGAGPFLTSLVAALFNSGLQSVHVVITDAVPTHRSRLVELASHARKTDREVELEEICLPRDGVNCWREVVQPFDSILYVSQVGDMEELGSLHRVCREEKKLFLPALCLQQVGMAGPLVSPDAQGEWESAFRRIHQSAQCKDPLLHTFSSTAGAMLANVIVFELLKTLAGVTDADAKNQFFLLNLETLEGDWHSFRPHPLVIGYRAIEWIQDLQQMLESDSSNRESNGLLPYFSRLTSPVSGIFHVWEEGDLDQLPLAQCRVQAVDPLSDGPATLLPDVICSGLTHEEARREAGLVGIEAYVVHMLPGLHPTFLPPLPAHQGVARTTLDPQGFVGVGAGGTAAEGVSRGLQKCLAAEFAEQQAHLSPSIYPVHVSAVEDERCRFYLQALTTMEGEPVIGLGQEVFGFPVMWIGTNGRWYGSVGLTVTMALRNVLQQALVVAQSPEVTHSTEVLETVTILLQDKLPGTLTIPISDDDTLLMALQSAVQVLERNRKRILVLDLALEPFLKEELAGVFGVLLQEEESP